MTRAREELSHGAFSEALQRRQRATEVVGMITGGAAAIMTAGFGIFRDHLPQALADGSSMNLSFFCPALVFICAYGWLARRAVGTRWYAALSAGHVAMDVGFVWAAFILVPGYVQPHLGLLLILPVLTAGVRFGLGGALWTWLSLMLVFALYTHQQWDQVRAGGSVVPPDALIEPFLTGVISLVVAFLIGHQSNVTVRHLQALEVAHLALEHQAMHDPLTGLANRSALARRAPHLTGHGALLLIDLDGFKSVNDIHGHAVGDEVLEVVASRLQAHTAADDLVVRLGGDEFLVLLMQATVESAEQMAAHLGARLQQPMDTQAGVLRLGASIGVAVSRPEDPCWDIEAMTHEADAKMYAIKQSGRHAGTPSPDADPARQMVRQR